MTHARHSRLRYPFISAIAAALLLTMPPRSAGASFLGSLVVTVVSSDGSPVTNAGIQIWGAGVGLAVVTVNGTFTFQALAAATYRVTVATPGGCRAEQMVVVGGAQVVVPFVVPQNCSDQLHVTPADDVIALLDVRAGVAPACVNDFLPLLQGAGYLMLPQNALQLTSGGTTCQGAAAILSKDHAFWFSHDPAAFPWTDALGDIVPVSLSPSRLAVPMKIFLASGSLANTTEAAKVDQIRTIHLAKAEQLLHDSYTGLRLSDIDGISDPVIENLMVTNAAALTDIGKGCANASRIMANATIYDPGRLNVYYVDAIEVGGLASSNSGRNCVAYGAPNIVFIANANPFTLVHEVGHALGLQRPAWGHTDLLAGFLRDATNLGLNVMAETSGLDAKYFSVGQVVRLHLNTASWLNLPSATDGSSVRSRAAGATPPVVDACSCPETVATADCSALGIDVPRPGIPQPGPLQRLACSVTLATPSISLTCGTSQLVEASLWQGTLSGVGDMELVTLSPTIVSATETTPTSPSVKHATITGLSPGVGKVRVWSGGSFTDLDVTVNPPSGGSCP